VIITGGASGIGLATGRALAAVGRPVSLWDLNADAARLAAEAIAADYGVAAQGLGLDVRDAKSLSQGLAAARAALPALGGLVHCAGTARTTGIEGISLEEHLQAITKVFMLKALERCGGVQTQAAELLRMSFRSFRYYAKKYDLIPRDRETDDVMVENE